MKNYIEKNLLKLTIISIINVKKHKDILFI